MAKINYRETYTDRDAARSAHARNVETADWYFDHFTKPQRAERDAALISLMGTVGPRADRERDAVRAKFAKDTAKARKLRDDTLRMLGRSGEVSEAMSLRWDSLQAVPVVEAAE
jgi:hypothetical protein